ncbi:hypothetical protein HPO96_30825 [Kribbella sandramycini]|uniref:Uncharacterized protein n=1 Tax=Kribbella sandramycini TaxID=60450 RepID=A0A7Y4L7B9_9ACTN|nr:hypothetical protein [Kribbella sandramycini]MBB6566929.1 hypothetical protein [Kribbella sandramycini]NOL44651.1 hypothetical protein [Kribbella sandramycini]
MTGEVPNPYKSAVGRALGTVRGHATTVSTALDAAKKAFAAGAWTGGTSAAFLTDLTGNGTSAKGGADACVTELESIYAKEPDKVEPGAWQIHWRNL